MVESGLFAFISRLAQALRTDQNKGFLPVLYSKVFHLYVIFTKIWSLKDACSGILQVVEHWKKEVEG